jgi:hypothetical protein
MNKTFIKCENMIPFMYPLTIDFTPEEIFTLEARFPNISSQIAEAFNLLTQPGSQYAIIYLKNGNGQTYIPMQLVKAENRLIATQIPLVHGVGLYRTGDEFTDLEGLVQKGLVSDNFPNSMVISTTDSPESYGYTSGSELQETFGDKYWLEIWELEIPDENANLPPQKRNIFDKDTQPRVKFDDGGGIFASVYTAQPSNFSILIQINPKLDELEREKRQTFYQEKFWC